MQVNIVILTAPLKCSVIVTSCTIELHPLLKSKLRLLTLNLHLVYRTLFHFRVKINVGDFDQQAETAQQP